jgi:hypothetical protein
MEFRYSPECAMYFPEVVEDPKINWATPLDVIAVASLKSKNRGAVPFRFVNDRRRINAYFYELKLADEQRESGLKLFSERMAFDYNRKGYFNSSDVSAALNSEVVRRTIDGNKPSYYTVDPRIKSRWNSLAVSTKKLLIPAGIGFCDRFGCDINGRLLYR